ncbi:hypothetical protein [uncultured Microbacterium sp.]|uniref:hypothetical protein n=1 Tax=uncultured Microbacterium sp. TaxID=191216 RepID=UPI0028D3D00D|nr:hypothetical protein [uncultured Microbacterium sp.]
MIKISGSTIATLDQVQAGLDGMAELLDALEARLDRLESAWNGEAREAFAISRRRWNSDIRALRALAASARERATRHIGDVDDFDARRAGAWAR